MSDIPRYTENELRVHISQAVAAAVERERERCARICDELEAEAREMGYDSNADLCAAAIRGITTDAASG